MARGYDPKTLFCFLASVAAILAVMGLRWPVWGRIEYANRLAFFYFREGDAGFWFVEFDREADTERLVGAYEAYAGAYMPRASNWRLRWRQRSKHYTGYREPAVCRRATWIAAPVWLPAVTLAFLAALLIAPPLLLRHRRRNLNQCIHCGYSRTGSCGPRCPECGEET